MEEDTPVRTDFTKEMRAIATVSTQEKPEGYTQVLKQLFSTTSADQATRNAKAWLISLLGSDIEIEGVPKPGEALSIISSRPLLRQFTDALVAWDGPAEAKQAIGTEALELLRPRVVSFEEQDTALRFLVADAAQAQEDFIGAARMLETIPLQTNGGGARGVTDEMRASVWVRIARCYLEEEDATAAGAAINRAKNVMHNVNDAALRLQFSTAQARILDAQRQFLAASNAYHTISYDALVDEDDRLRTLSAAITCAVLAPAGPPRARVLAKLYRDDRATEVDEFAILQRIFLDQMLDPAQVAAFAARLRPHQLATTSDGATVLDRAVLEHNLLAASRLYANITFDQLGALLAIDPARAEQYAALMIEQRRLPGHIDQIDRVIFFDAHAAAPAQPVVESSAATNGTSAAGAQAGAAVDKSIATVAANATAPLVGGQELRRWDVSVQGLLDEVEKITTMIAAEFPDFYEANMAY